MANIGGRRCDDRFFTCHHILIPIYIQILGHSRMFFYAREERTTTAGRTHMEGLEEHGAYGVFATRDRIAFHWGQF